jgi:hypothetical protein
MDGSFMAFPPFETALRKPDDTSPKRPNRRSDLKLLLQGAYSDDSGRSIESDQFSERSDAVAYSGELTAWWRDLTPVIRGAAGSDDPLRPRVGTSTVDRRINPDCAGGALKTNRKK